MVKAWRAAGMFLCLAAGSALAQPASDTQALRRELDALRADYEARLLALEQRLKAAEAAVAASPPPAAQTPAAAAVTTAAPQGSPGRGFTPEISLILGGAHGRSSRDPATYRIRGFDLPVDAEAGPGVRGFSLGETELTFSANIDPWFRGVATVALTPENEAEVEEAHVQTTALGSGLTLRAGRFLSGVGYLNSQHAHTQDFGDLPLAYQAILGGQYKDDGVQLTWLAPTDRFVELRAEAARGGTSGNGAGMFSLSAHTGDDIGESHSWRAGVSLLRTRADGQQLASLDAAGGDIVNAFTGSQRVWIADAVWKWAPQGNATRTNFKLQGEYLHATRDGSMLVDADGAASPGSFRSVQSGWYLQGVYQFMPRWRMGLRTESLRPGSPDFGANNGLVGLDSGTPRKHTLMLEHNPSEFSRVRLQVAQDRARAGPSDIQWLLQYQMSLGAHGAHGY